uniref:CCHC-type domain-containing protein n=1 Tax=Tanacetum cinerariifolium TaxID=118510 RepID=A0A6L2M6R3_TANCI|nr:hypothetical protein [Tanacetum cinerariifolium]
MPPRMTTRSAGRQTAAPRGGRTGGRTGSGGGRTEEPTGIIGGQTSNLVKEGDVRSVNVNNGRNGCSYKGFMACTPKDYNGKVQTKGREATVSITWEDFKVFMRKEFCPNNEMQKLKTKIWCHAMNKRIERYIDGLASQIRAMVATTEPTTIQSVVLKAGMLTGEAIRNRSLRKNTEKRRNDEEPSRDRNVREDNKRSRTGRAFSSTTNPVRREYTGAAPKCTNCNFHHNPKMPCRKCMKCNGLGHFAKDCRTGPRMVNPVNARNPTAARGACFECGGTDHYMAACPRLNRAPGQ